MGDKNFLIAGNWKMNKTIAEAKEFADKFKGIMPDNGEGIAIIAPFTQLQALKESFKDTEVMIGAQNVHYEQYGAYTGEISVKMLKEIGIDCCVIGHSERRQYFNETDEALNKKLKVLLENDITPILCVGEPLEVREKNEHMGYVGGQLFEDLKDIDPLQVRKIVIAYEPIWAIGTGKTATPEQADDMCGFIHSIVAGYCGDEAAAGLKVLYGGSMKPGNAEALLKQKGICGGLIGGASLSPESFVDICNIASEMKNK